jgi:lysine-specific demethylase 8
MQRVDTREPGDVLGAIQARRPILIRGLIDNWNASGWTFESLRGIAGDQTVKALVDLPLRGGVLNGGQDAYEKELRFSAFLDQAQDPGTAPCYLGYTRPGELIPGYEDAFDFSPMTIPSRYPTDTRLWIGSAGTCSGLHSDLKDNIFAQISGRKRLILVPFRQTRLVYPFRDNIVNSMVDPEHLDTARFPRFLKASVLECVVGPGDVVYIPRGWWHYLRSESPSISINHWFGPPIPARVFVATLVRLGAPYVGRAVLDLMRYSLLGRTYRGEFFFTPPSTGERLFSLLRHGDFSRDNDPAATGK